MFVVRTHSSASSELKSNALPSSTMSRKLKPDSKVVWVSEHTVVSCKQKKRVVVMQQNKFTLQCIKKGQCWCPQGIINNKKRRKVKVMNNSFNCACLPVTAGNGIYNGNETMSNTTINLLPSLLLLFLS